MKLSLKKKNKTIGISLTFPLHSINAFLAIISRVWLFCAIQNKNITPKSFINSELSNAFNRNLSGTPAILAKINASAIETIPVFFLNIQPIAIATAKKNQRQYRI